MRGEGAYLLPAPRFNRLCGAARRKVPAILLHSNLAATWAAHTAADTKQAVRHRGCGHQANHPPDCAGSPATTASTSGEPGFRRDFFLPDLMLSWTHRDFGPHGFAPKRAECIRDKSLGLYKTYLEKVHEEIHMARKAN